MKIVLLGAPGAGKGTQAVKIAEKYNIPHISTGDIFRKNIKEQTPIGVIAKSYIDKGNLVPDDVTIEIVKNRLAEDDCKKGFILDGFPRNVYQAEALLNITELNVVLDIHVPTENLMARLTGRRVCSGCGESYHVTTLEGRNTCARCGENLYQRDDDNEQTVAERLAVYHKQTEPLIEFYKAKALLKTVNGDQDADAVTAEVLNVLERL
ncbi:MAG: adenylate kinase [Clostridia bacterium]|nr:adenylate kinase [Clostridia bacterium]